MAVRIIHVAEGQAPADGRAWVVVRRTGERFRVNVNDPRNPNPVVLEEPFASFWTALLEARKHAARLAVPIHAVGCDEAA